ncbi:hypothetical protein PF008_g11506 [Phytophthora fragariae]|uniref:Uncharacterized protein n=1 Tax=Phytophthora fragariae TaxID=53985 RepID=A0A6G0RQP4_9STRA|nr:hypothetical protein PF008_g11506 [Phytophthora fragariae]
MWSTLSIIATVTEWLATEWVSASKVVTQLTNVTFAETCSGISWYATQNTSIVRAGAAQVVTGGYCCEGGEAELLIAPPSLNPRALSAHAQVDKLLEKLLISELLAKFADQVVAAAHVDNFKLEHTHFAEHPVVETGSSMASDTSAFFLNSTWSCV